MNRFDYRDSYRPVISGFMQHSLVQLDQEKMDRNAKRDLSMWQHEVRRSCNLQSQGKVFQFAAGELGGREIDCCLLQETPLNIFGENCSNFVRHRQCRNNCH